jgi:hypothetical protein
VNWPQVAIQLGTLAVGFVSVVGSLFWSSKVVAAKDAQLKAKDAELKAKDGELKVKEAELRVKEAELAAVTNIFEQKQGLIELQAKFEARATIVPIVELASEE